MELAYLLQREAGSADIPQGTVPSIVDVLLAEIEARGLTEEGLCTHARTLCPAIAERTADRIAGQKSVNDRIKDLFNSGTS